jgi:hypothetical protein
LAKPFGYSRKNRFFGTYFFFAAAFFAGAFAAVFFAGAFFVAAICGHPLSSSQKAAPLESEIIPKKTIPYALPSRGIRLLAIMRLNIASLRFLAL